MSKLVLRYEPKFDVILADPPWHFKTWSTKGRKKSPKYPTMALADIIYLGDLVRQVSADNCALFMWTTMPFLERSFEVIRAWGFQYKTVAFTWIKSNKNGGWFRGTGYYTRANAELCLLGIKGKMPVPPSSRPEELIVSQRREHSRKPDESYDKIMGMYPGTTRLELFASEHSEIEALRHRFTPLGFDVDGLDIRVALQALIDTRIA